MGYSLFEVRGTHHGIFVESASDVTDRARADREREETIALAVTVARA